MSRNKQQKKKPGERNTRKVIIFGPIRVFSSSFFEPNQTFLPSFNLTSFMLLSSYYVASGDYLYMFFKIYIPFHVTSSYFSNNILVSYCYPPSVFNIFFVA